MGSGGVLVVLVGFPFSSHDDSIQSHPFARDLALTSWWSCLSRSTSRPQWSGSQRTAMSVSFSKMSRLSSLLRHKHSSTRSARLACC